MSNKMKYNRMETVEFLGESWEADSGILLQDALCSRIGILLAKNGLSYADAAHLLGKKTSYIRKILSGDKRMTICDAHHLLSMMGYEFHVEIKKREENDSK